MIHQYHIHIDNTFRWIRQYFVDDDLDIGEACPTDKTGLQDFKDLFPRYS